MDMIKIEYQAIIDFTKIISKLVERLAYLEEMADNYKYELNDAREDFEQAEYYRQDLQKKLDDQREIEKINERRIDELKNKLKARNADVELLVKTHDEDMRMIRKIQSFVSDEHRVEFLRALTPHDYCEMLAILHLDKTPAAADPDTGEEEQELDPWAIPDEEFFEDDDEDDKDGGFF